MILENVTARIAGADLVGVNLRHESGILAVVGSPADGYCDAPPAFATVFKRTTVPPAQRNPSPNVAPRPPFTCAVPWKYSAELVPGICEPESTSVSKVMLASPLAISLPPVPSELRQPDPSPTGEALPHGHAVALPSPERFVSPHTDTMLIRIENGGDLAGGVDVGASGDGKSQ